MKHKSQMKASGYTLIELMLVVAILGVLASIATPRFDMMTQRSWQAASKGNLGAIRSSLALYYSEMEGVWPMQGHPAGFPGPTEALSLVMTPKYIEKIPTPKLVERVVGFNGFPDLIYDEEVKVLMAQNPPKDVVIIPGAPASPAGFDMPFVYDPAVGLIYLCNGNYDLAGTQRFYEW